MSPLAFLLFFGCALGLLACPRRLAAVPLLVGCCYITTGQGLELGPFRFPIFRLLLVVGLGRVLFRGERLEGGFSKADALMLAWCAWTFFASFFQEWEPGSGPKYNTGVIFNIAGVYFLVRVLCQNAQDTVKVLGTACLILAPVAVAMVCEQILGKNIFSVFGGIPETPIIRDGRVRAQGPFSHPILAGTVGAACLPFAAAIWAQDRVKAIIGGTACLLMVAASASSGPIMSLLFSIFAIGMWHHRQHCAKLVKLAVLAYVVLIFVMSQPPYFLVARINLTGSSTGWHRAYLIQQTIEHFDEWVWVGTEYTKHWMPRQGAISEKHTDITNYYISFGILGGLLSMTLVIAQLWWAFRSVGAYVRRNSLHPTDAFSMWCLGASVFSHAASSLSVAYFGQSQVFFWMPIACIASLYAGERAPVAEPKRSDEAALNAPHLSCADYYS